MKPTVERKQKANTWKTKLLIAGLGVSLLVALVLALTVSGVSGVGSVQNNAPQTAPAADATSETGPVADADAAPATGAPQHPASGPVAVGVAAPDFELENVRGGKLRLSDLRGKPVLLSFIQVHETRHADQAQETRKQVNFVRSMHAQYATKGLQVILVDAAYIKTGRFSERSPQINFTYDWMLDRNRIITAKGVDEGKVGTIPLLADTPEKRVAEVYGVKIIPTTFLLDGRGVVRQRWDNVVLTHQMAFAIEALVGAPEYREAQAGGASAFPPLDTSPESTPAQSKFHGFGLVRPLSDRIWLVDGGCVWPSNEPFPVNWLVLYERPAALKIRVTARPADGGTGQVLLDKPLERLPQEEASKLLTNLPEFKGEVYFHHGPATLPGPGRYEISAAVYETEGQPLLTGTARIKAK